MLCLRYKLLPYLYTLIYEAHLTGAPVARPVFFSFPEFAPSYGLSTQFLLGPGVMVSPVLEKGATSVKAMFPPGTWYNLFDMTKSVISKDASLITLDAPLNEVNVHIYQGMVLSMQRGGVISKEARQTPFTLVIAFPNECLIAEIWYTVQGMGLGSWEQIDCMAQIDGSPIEHHSPFCLLQIARLLRSPRDVSFH
jgi:alpha-glucosidase (family GH31 glycosyl hydrolase)